MFDIKKDHALGLDITTLMPVMKKIHFVGEHESEVIVTKDDRTYLLDMFRYGEDGNEIFFLSCQDHTEWRRFLNQYRSMNKKAFLAEEMYNAMSDGIFITDGQGITLYVNDAFVNLSGLNRENIIGKSVYSLMEQGIVPNSCAAHVIESGGKESTINNFYMGKSCLVTGTPVFVDEKLRRVVCIVRDMTELKCLQDKLDNATALSLSYRKRLSELETKQANVNVRETRCKEMKEIYDKTIKVATFDTPILLLGETGVGKDFMAHFIHDVAKKENDSPLIKINCGAIPESLLVSELFGYEPGAFTDARKQGKIGLFELANNGTLYLDEIGEMPLSLQIQLLGVLQDKEFQRLGGTKTVKLNARIIAATNKNLEQAIEKGEFRRDLYYRLNVVTITVPPLRNRRDDIIPLAMLFLQEFNGKFQKARFFFPKTLDAFRNYGWPGNIREMRNVIERMVIISNDDCLYPQLFKEQLSNLVESGVSESIALFDENSDANGDVSFAGLFNNDPGDGRSLRELLDDCESAIIQKALERFPNLHAAAQSLAIDISTLVRKKKRHNIHWRFSRKGFKGQSKGHSSIL